jgi:parvulin-like peptidyl-prolyl isomerase
MRDLSKSIKVTDKDVKALYEKNKKMFKTPVELKVSHILLEKEEDAKSLIKKLNKSKKLKADFTKMAKEKSIGPSAPDGGELRWSVPEGFVPEFRAEALKLKKGEMTKAPVKSQYGYHIIYLDDKKQPKQIPLNKIENKVKQLAAQDKFVKTLREKAEKLKSKAKIEYK